MRITKITKSDLPILIPFAKRVFYDAFFHQNKVSNYQSYVGPAFTEEKFAEELDNDASHFYWICDDENVPLAWLKLNEKAAFTEKVEGKGLEIQRIYIDVNSQGKGIGKILLNFTTDFALEKNLAFIWLGVWEKNQNAIAFYEKCGYVKFSQHDFVFGDEIQTDYLMRKEI